MALKAELQDGGALGLPAVRRAMVDELALGARLLSYDPDAARLALGTGSSRNCCRGTDLRAPALATAYHFSRDRVCELELCLVLSAAARRHVKSTAKLKRATPTARTAGEPTRTSRARKTPYHDLQRVLGDFTIAR